MVAALGADGVIGGIGSAIEGGTEGTREPWSAERLFGGMGLVQSQGHGTLLIPASSSPLDGVGEGVHFLPRSDSTAPMEP